MDLAHIAHLSAGAGLLGGLVDLTVASTIFLLVKRRRALRAAAA